MGAALTALRLPFKKDVRSSIVMRDEQYMSTNNMTKEKTHFFIRGGSINVANKDLELMQTLVTRGDEHAKVVRGIVVYTEITAPIYWWRELETYRAGHERLASESTMHIDCKGLTGEELRKAKADIPMGHPCTCVDMFSYQCLRNIVRQRKNHRLPEWKEFIEWVHGLPLAEELIFVGLNDKEE